MVAKRTQTNKYLDHFVKWTRINADNLGIIITSLLIHFIKVESLTILFKSAFICVHPWFSLKTHLHLTRNKSRTQPSYVT